MKILVSNTAWTIFSISAEWRVGSIAVWPSDIVSIKLMGSQKEPFHVSCAFKSSPTKNLFLPPGWYEGCRLRFFRCVWLSPLVDTEHMIARSLFHTSFINSLAPGRCGSNINDAIFGCRLQISLPFRNCYQVNAAEHPGWEVNIGSGNGLVLWLPEPMLTWLYATIWSH